MEPTETAGENGTVSVTLDSALAGRPVLDGCAELVEPSGELSKRSRPMPWDRVRWADDRTLIVYWLGGLGGPDRITTELAGDRLVVTVWERGGGRMAGRYWVSITSVQQQVSGATVVDGAKRS
jgi:hypothetical protein